MNVGSWPVPALDGELGHTDFAKTVDWGTESKINIGDLITHVMPLEKISEGFDLMHKGESIRSVVVC